MQDHISKRWDRSAVITAIRPDERSNIIKASNSKENIRSNRFLQKENQEPSPGSTTISPPVAMPRRSSHLQERRTQDSALDPRAATVQHLQQQHGRIAIENRGGAEGSEATFAKLGYSQCEPQVGGAPCPRATCPDARERLRSRHDDRYHHCNSLGISEVPQEIIGSQAAQRGRQTSFAASPALVRQVVAGEHHPTCIYAMEQRANPDPPAHAYFRPGPSYIASRGTAELRATCALSLIHI